MPTFADFLRPDSPAWNHRERPDASGAITERSGTTVQTDALRSGESEPADEAVLEQMAARAVELSDPYRMVARTVAELNTQTV